MGREILISDSSNYNYLPNETIEFQEEKSILVAWKQFNFTMWGRANIASQYRNYLTDSYVGKFIKEEMMDQIN